MRIPSVILFFFCSACVPVHGRPVVASESMESASSCQTLDGEAQCELNRVYWRLPKPTYTGWLPGSTENLHYFRGGAVCTTSPSGLVCVFPGTVRKRKRYNLGGAPTLIWSDGACTIEPHEAQCVWLNPLDGPGHFGLPMAIPLRINQPDTKRWVVGRTGACICSDHEQACLLSGDHKHDGGSQFPPHFVDFSTHDERLCQMDTDSLEGLFAKWRKAD